MSKIVTKKTKYVIRNLLFLNYILLYFFIAFFSVVFFFTGVHNIDLSTNYIRICWQFNIPYEECFKDMTLTGVVYDTTQMYVMGLTQIIVSFIVLGVISLFYVVIFSYLLREGEGWGKKI